MAKNGEPYYNEEEEQRYDVCSIPHGQQTTIAQPKWYNCNINSNSNSTQTKYQWTVLKCCCFLLLWSSLTADTKADGLVFISLFKLYLLSWRRLLFSFFLSYRELSPSFIFAKSCCCCCHLLFSSSILVLGRQQQSQQQQSYSLTIDTTWHQQSNMIYLIIVFIMKFVYW